MTRNLKALGLALVAVFAMSAIAAQGASAATHHYVAENGGAAIDITGTGHAGDQVFIGTGVEITCKELTLEGTQAEEIAKTVSLTPKYANCTSPVGTATVTDNGCKYELTGETTAEAEHTKRANVAPINLVCSHTGNITITSGGCTITFADTHSGDLNTVNQKLEGLVLNNVADPVSGKNTITAEAHVFTVRYIVTGANCALLKLKTGTHEDGTVRGNAVIRGYKHGLAHTEVNQVGIKTAAT